jgi:hypothetical protein
MGNDLIKIVDWLKHSDVEDCPMFRKVLNGCLDYPFDDTRWLPLPWDTDGKPIFPSDKDNQAAIVSHDCFHVSLLFFVHCALFTVNISW